MIISFFYSLLSCFGKDNGPRGMGQFCGGMWVSFWMESTPDPCGSVQWDPVSALVWSGGGALLGAGMFGIGYGGWALAVHFGWVTPTAGPLFWDPVNNLYQRYANTTATMLPRAQNGVGKSLTAAQIQGASAADSVRTEAVAVYRYMENGTVRYIGVTNDFVRRAYEHGQARGWQIERIPGLESLSRFEARAVEQVLIEQYGLVNLNNRINSVSAINPIYPEAIRTGREILDTIGY